MYILSVIKKYGLILQNASHLALIELIGLVMPFVTLPYLIVTVGAEKYGLVIFVQTIISYFSYFINFGMDVSAVRDVAVHRNSIKKLSEIVSTVLFTKFLFFVLSLLFLIFLLQLYPFGKEHQSLFFVAFISCFYDVLFPVWLYQGLEKMKYLTIVRTSSMIVFTISVFLLVKSPDHFERIALLQSLSNLAAGIVSVIIMLRVVKIRFNMPSRNDVVVAIKDAFPFFLSRISNFFNGSISKVICGAFFSMQLVAAYELMSKVAAGVCLPMSMLNQSTYPHIAKNKDKIFATRYFLTICAISFVMGLVLFFGAPLAELIFAKGYLPESIPLMKIAAVSIFFAGIDVCMGAPILVSFGFSKPFNRSVYFASVVLLAALFLFYVTSCMTYMSFIIASTLAEIATTLYRLHYCIKLNLLVFPLKQN